MQTADVIIIGGGIAGIGCAVMLSETANVIVLEQEASCGYHTTGRSAAMHVPSYGPPAMRRLTVASEAYLQAPPDALATESLLTSRGDMMLACPGEEAELEKLLSQSASQKEISVAEAVERVPILRAEKISRVSFEAEASDIDVDRLLQSWIRLLRQRRGQIETQAPVTSIKRDSTDWIVAAGTHDYRAPVVVNAAGAWGDQIAALAGLPAVGLSPCRRSAALLPAPDHEGFLQWPMFAGINEDWYSRPMSGRLMVSPADEDPVSAHDAAADDMRLAEGLDCFEKMVTLPIARVEHSWGGLRTFSADREPVVGFASNAPTFFWLVGQGGYGIQTAPALSRLAADLVLQNPLDDNFASLAALLSPSRFGG
ncbi:MAG: FAD-binding oxidoreductase [Gammaproteobacteria bacterium]|nr:FAD-binding oxidoreductase [Gammaproteobacteria bacterium]